ncbi:MAG: phage tail protein [Gemmatimonadota bacterium]
MRGSAVLETMAITGLFLASLIGPQDARAQGEISAERERDPATKSDAKLGLANRFSITIDGVAIASFSEASLNARAKPPTVVLKRGKSSSMEMWTWHEAVRMGDMAAARKSATLVMYNYDGKPIARYKLTNAWPSKIETSGLSTAKDADGEVAVETLELAHEGFLETVTIVAERIQRVSP